jgi:hypothetical protein
LPETRPGICICRPRKRQLGGTNALLSQPCTSASRIGSAQPDKPARRVIKTLHLTHSNCRRATGAPWPGSRALGQVGEPHLTQRGWSLAKNNPAIGNLCRGVTWHRNS